MDWAARELGKASGLDEQTALRYLSLIGDHPEVDAEGRTVIRDRLGIELEHVLFNLSRTGHGGRSECSELR